MAAKPLKQFLVSVSIRDGEREYWQLVLMEAENSEEANKNGLDWIEQWTKNDCQVATLERVACIPFNHFEILQQYL